MEDLAEWLRARLDQLAHEQGVGASEAGTGGFRALYDGYSGVLEELVSTLDLYTGTADERLLAESLLRRLSVPFRDHPGYREEWLPTDA
ncbi:DUF6221 family protein [Saccharothrix lopnurensis]|uniref:DUF6221 family protein n=1 Tax=Saccharothrix lopnurensis TaxID=1670621 RepID=A0ABW1NWZ4_9PSEU